MKNIFKSKKELRKSGIFISIIIVFLFYLIPFLLGHSTNPYILYLSLIILTISIYFPSLLKKPLQVWMLIGERLGSLNSNIILFLFFMLAIFPASILIRLFRNFKLNKSNKSLASYYKKTDNMIGYNFKDQI